MSMNKIKVYYALALIAIIICGLNCNDIYNYNVKFKYEGIYLNNWLTYIFRVCVINYIMIVKLVIYYNMT